MKHLTKAIEDAVKGGYKTAPYYKGKELTPEDCQRIAETLIEMHTANAMLLDAAFWRALGKARGWNKYDADLVREGLEPSTEWVRHWHRLIDTLASGGSIEEFFTTLN